MRSKFTAETRNAVLQVLSAGGSRREAARAAGIDHATLGRWIARGTRAIPGGRFAEFYDSVLEAELGDHRLVALKRQADAIDHGDVGAALTFLEQVGEIADLAPIDPDPEVIVMRWPDDLKEDRDR